MAVPRLYLFRRWVECKCVGGGKSSEEFKKLKKDGSFSMRDLCKA